METLGFRPRSGKACRDDAGDRLGGGPGRGPGDRRRQGPRSYRGQDRVNAFRIWRRSGGIVFAAVRTARGRFEMVVRLAIVLAGVTIALPALAQEMNPEQARRFVVGKTFAYTCFEGTAGVGRIHGDGSVAGTIQLQGSGPVRRAALPAGTLQVKGAKVCASVKGMPFEPCFNIQQTSTKSFRGSISGFGFAYCDFVRG